MSESGIAARFVGVAKAVDGVGELLDCSLYVDVLHRWRIDFCGMK